MIKLNLTIEQVAFALRVSKALHVAANNSEKLREIAKTIDGLLSEKNDNASQE